MRVGWFGGLGLVAAGSWLVVSCGGDSAQSRCVPGTSSACACVDGSVGAQVCAADGTFDACVCDENGPSAGSGNTAGSAGAGTPGGASSTEQAGVAGAEAESAGSNEGGAAGAFGGTGGAFGGTGGAFGGTGGSSAGNGGAAGSAVGGTGGAGAGGGRSGSGGAGGGCTHPDPEWCDGQDNDCDGVVDNGEVCPDPAVKNVDAFTDGVYFLGTTSEGSCGADALRRFWPTLATTWFTGFDCYADTYAFRRTDNTIFYTATFAGLYQDTANKNDTLVATPPCGAQVDSYYENPNFGFDSSGALYYQCSDTVRRDNGVLIAQSIKRLAAVLGDGRTVVTRASQTSANQDDFVVLDAAGNELSRLNPRASFSGTLTVDLQATTVSGNLAYVAFERSYGQSQMEIVAYRLTAASTWQRMRRVAVNAFGLWRLVISDGTIFIRENDPLTTFDQRIRALFPTGEDKIVWREADQTGVKAHIGDQLLVGPP